MILFILSIIILIIALPLIIIKCKGKTTMQCPQCGHQWTMNSSVYMTTPYIKRGENKLFVCSKCGNQGEKR